MIIINYAIFRSEPIYTLNDLAQIGSHNKREKKAYNSNPNIKLELTKDNIEIVPLKEKYVKGFHDLVKDYEKEHNERMKNEREDRKRTFNQMLNKSKNVVADELLFTATHQFFNSMRKEEIKEWADTCMEFVYEDLGYKKEQILHATVHLDEETPHLHCVVIPLIKKLDKRTNTNRYTISENDKNKILEYIDKVDKTNADFKRTEKLSVTLNNVDTELEENREKIKILTENNEALSLKVDTLSKNIDNKNKEIKELKKDNKHLEELVDHFKDLFDRLINFIKHKILGKDREREDYWEFSKDLYEHGIFSEKTITDIKEDYNWSKEYDKNKDHDDFDLEI